MKNSLIQDVSDTAFMVAIYRMLESERPHPLFRDPLAAKLAGERGRKIVASLPKDAFLSGWTVVIRTCIIDDFIQSALAEGVDTIVNLGAGLDTRPYRMNLPASLRWIEVDYPHVIDVKEKELATDKPRCRLERVRLDLADAPLRRSFLAEIARSSQTILVLTEGVVPYLSNENVAALAEDLRAQPTFRYWVVDYFSPASYKYRRRKKMQDLMRNAPFLFEPEDYFAFFAAEGWQPQQIRYIPEEAERLKRPIPLPWTMKLILKITGFFAPAERRRAFQRFSAYILMEAIPAKT